MSAFAVRHVAVIIIAFTVFALWCILGILAMSFVDRDGKWIRWLETFPWPTLNPLLFALIWPYICVVEFRNWIRSLGVIDE